MKRISEGFQKSERLWACLIHTPRRNDVCFDCATPIRPLSIASRTTTMPTVGLIDPRALFSSWCQRTLKLALTTSTGTYYIFSVSLVLLGYYYEHTNS